MREMRSEKNQVCSTLKHLEKGTLKFIKIIIVSLSFKI